MVNNPEVSRSSDGADSASALDVSSFEAHPSATYQMVRAATLALCEPLELEDYGLQSATECSPPKWHLAHTTWFFETFVLSAALEGYQPFHPKFGYLFNSYYETVGRMHPRPQRGLLSRPTVREVERYRAHVDQHMASLLERGSLDPAILKVVETGLHHEQQHQELLLTDLKHAFSLNAMHPVYRGKPHSPGPDPGALRWIEHPGGVAKIGHRGPGFAFDNEGPRHRVFSEPFALSSRLITVGEYLEFMADGGYERAELWLSDGWHAVQTQGWKAPAYWMQRDGHWEIFTLDGMRALDRHEPVCHVSLYEADAYARWTGFRLPSEFEWEINALELPVRGNFVESGSLHPRGPSEQTASNRPTQMFGDVWEWTGSAYAPYPAYRAPEGALGEYNGKFMCNQLVLRGGSCATPAAHARATYRNFFHPDARWQFSGIRLARDL